MNQVLKMNHDNKPQTNRHANNKDDNMLQTTGSDKDDNIPKLQKKKVEA